MPWAARLLAVACVSLAAKMEEYRAPALSEFRADDEYDFSCASIRRMELLVLSTLGWRMGGVTPFDYLPCLSSRLRRGGGAGGGLAAAKAPALIFTTAEGWFFFLQPHPPHSFLVMSENLRLQLRACSTTGRPPWPSPPSWRRSMALCQRKRWSRR